MLLKVDKAIQEALQRVAECGQRAKTARTPRERKNWQIIEASWLSLARNREDSEHLESFRTSLKNRERELSDRYGVRGADSAKCDTELVSASAVAHANSGAEIDLPPVDLSKDAAMPSGRLSDGLELRSMVSVEELKLRPSRPPDYAVEIQALIALNQSMVVSPEGILQKVAETALALCGGQSAGISLLEDADQKKNFHWRALVGAWAPHLNGGTPRDFGPCGLVLDRNAPQICRHPELDFPYLAEALPFIEDGLLIPFYLRGEAFGSRERPLIRGYLCGLRKI